MATMTDEARPRAFDPSVRSHLDPDPHAPGWDLAVERRIDDGETLARMLGWFSLGLGVAQVTAPGRLCRFLGMEDRTDLMRVYGLREIGKGAGLLMQERPERWIWARIAGDLLDLGTLATALTPDNPKRDRVIGAMVAVAGVTALDVVCIRQLRSRRDQPAGPQ